MIIMKVTKVNLHTQAVMDHIPITTTDSLEDVTAAKVKLLTCDFESRYGIPPQFIVRVPGRWLY